MNDFHPLSFLIGIVAGSFGIVVLLVLVMIFGTRKLNKDMPEPQDWSKHAR